MAALLAAAAFAGGAGAPAAPKPVGSAAAAARGPVPFLPELETAKLPQAPSGWLRADVESATRALGHAAADDRQRLRWTYAMAQLSARAPELALGALHVMAQDEPDLRLVPAWRLAEGRALAETGRFGDALGALDAAGLVGNPEACAWRLLALARLRAHGGALQQLSCAWSAIAARPAAERRPFLTGAADMALAAGRPAAALRWLRFVPADAPEVRLLRGEALLALGRRAAGLAILSKASSDLPTPLRVGAETSLLRARHAAGELRPAEALRRAESLRFGWRGDGTERALALLSWDYALAAGRPRPALQAAATLLRYYPAEPRLPVILAVVNGNFAHWLEPSSGAPLPSAAGLIWDYRDLLPGGPGGDRIVRKLAMRLKAEALYDRAADLLDHQLGLRARDVAQGPLSLEVAELRLLAGKPKLALEVLRRTATTLYPDAIATARLRLEAVALFQLGEQKAALALIEGVGGAQDLRAELLWRQRDWAALAKAPLGGAEPLTDARQVLVLRRVIAAAMIDDRAELARLRAGYGRAFARLPSGAAFRALTDSEGGRSGEAMASALAGLPDAAPAGGETDLLDRPLAGPAR